MILGLLSLFLISCDGLKSKRYLRRNQSELKSKLLPGTSKAEVQTYLGRPYFKGNSKKGEVIWNYHNFPNVKRDEELYPGTINILFKGNEIDIVLYGLRGK